MPSMDGPVITYTLMAGLIFASWTIMQNQFQNQSNAAKAQEDTLLIIVSDIKANVKDNTSGLVRSAEDIAAIKKQIEAINMRITDIEVGTTRRLDVVEQTRPTTGELKGTADGLSRQVDAVSGRVAQIETRNYDLATKASHSPVEAAELREMNDKHNALRQQVYDMRKDLTEVMIKSSPPGR